MRSQSFILSTSVLIAALFSSGVARAQVHFTLPAPSFEQALASARQAGKPLLMEFSTTWCGPCKILSRELRKPRAQPILDQVFFVALNGEDEPGMTLMQKYGLNSYPSFIVVDASGEEAARKSGYGRWSEFEEWVKSLPEQALPIDEERKAADAAPQNGKLQWNVGNRLLKSEHYADAQRYFERAQKAEPKEIAAQAAWTLLQLNARSEEQKAMRKPAEKLAASFPGSKEASKALRYLATLPTASPNNLPAMEALILKHLQEVKDPASLHSLAFVAMKLGALKAAVKVAAKLEPLVKTQATHLDALAEVAFYAEGRTDKAIWFAQRAVDAASADDKPRYSANLERFRRDKKEPSSELQKLVAPSLELPASERTSSPLPLLYRLRRPLQRSIRDSCWQHAQGGAESFEIIVLTAAKSSEHRALFPASTPAPLIACATKLIQSSELPEGEILTLSPDLVPLSVEEQLEETIGNAEENCAPQAGKTRSLRGVLRAEIGKPVTLHFLSAPADKPQNRDLASCIEQTFAPFHPARPLLRTVAFQFSED